jgi:hypothetical protein
MDRRAAPGANDNGKFRIALRAHRVSLP